MTNLVKLVFEVIGIFAFAMAFYFLGKVQGIKEGQGMFLEILANTGNAMCAMCEQKEGEDNANQG